MNLNLKKQKRFWHQDILTYDLQWTVSDAFFITPKFEKNISVEKSELGHIWCSLIGNFSVFISFDLAYSRITLHQWLGFGFTGPRRSNHGHGRWIRWVFQIPIYKCHVHAFWNHLNVCLCVLFLGFEIPDSDAERLFRPCDIVRYIADKEDIYE